MKVFLGYVGPGVGLLAWQAIVGAGVGALFYLKKTRSFVVKSLVKLTGRRKQPGVKPAAQLESTNRGT